MKNRQAGAIAREIQTQIMILGTFLAIFWGVETIDVRLVG